MRSTSQIRIEEIGQASSICLLRDRDGRSLGTGSRESLEVLRDIVERCRKDRFPKVGVPEADSALPFIAVPNPTLGR